jgi:hypothetical protein
MIVRSGDSVVHLITQPDHAALSRRIMEHWTPLAAEPRRASILHAIGEHDNGWREPDENPALAADGRVVDFVNAPAHVKQPVWSRGVARLAGNPLAAALVAQHAITVYDRFRADQEWFAFFAEMEASRDRFLARTGLAREPLLQDYTYVRLGDLISLTFCAGWRDEQTYNRWSVRLEASTHAVVTPDEFDAAEIAIDVPALELPDEPFKSESGFRDALAIARRVTLTGTVGRGG